MRRWHDEFRLVEDLDAAGPWGYDWRRSGKIFSGRCVDVTLLLFLVRYVGQLRRGTWDFAKLEGRN